LKDNLDVMSAEEGWGDLFAKAADIESHAETSSKNLPRRQQENPKSASGMSINESQTLWIMSLSAC
jgi:hypothetical protein